MFTYAIDEKLGLMVARLEAGADREPVPFVHASRRLAQCAGEAGKPKAALIVIAEGAPRADPANRDRVAAPWRGAPSLPVVAIVTSSALTRAVIPLFLLLLNRADSAPCRAVATRAEGLSFLESQRAGLRYALERLELERDYAARAVPAVSPTASARDAGRR